MRNQTIIQVEGLGVPVQAPTNRNEEGYEVRWSSDPEVSINARVHVLNSERELTRFVKLAVDQRFIQADLLRIVPVRTHDDSNSITREQALQAGISPDCWNLVRVGLVISGNGARGPVMDEIEWVGTREEHQEGVHLREAYEHAKRRNISQPTVFHQNQSSHIQKAADFMAQFHRQMKPSLRAAENMNRALEQAIMQLDCDNLNGDRAVHYLRQFQQALVNRQTMQQINSQSNFGNIEQQAPRPATQEPDAEEHNEPAARNTSGPRFH